MKRKILLIILLFSIFCISFGLAGTVNAAEPTYSEDTGYVLNGSQKCFFANGNEITIEARADGQEGATIFWAEGTKNVNVPNDINVFGGAHKDGTNYENTKITMNGGTVKNIFGGGLHESNVETANITVNGGKITVSITGGGANIFANSDACADSTRPAENSLTRVNTANVTINNGTVNLLYGGGEGYSYTGTTNTKINGGTFDYVTAGGSNGYTGNANIKVTSGTIGVMQSVNRGSIEAADMRLTGGTVNKLYVGGENDVNVTGTIAKVNLDITGGTEVANLYVGTSGGRVIGTNGVDTQADVDIYLGATVNIANEAEFANIPVTQYVFVTINDNRFELEKGKALKDLAELESIKNVEGKEFVKFTKKNSEEAFDENTLIENDIELNAIYRDKPVATPVIPKDDTPKSGVNEIDYVQIALSVIAIATVAGIYIVKKK